MTGRVVMGDQPEHLLAQLRMRWMEEDGDEPWLEVDLRPEVCNPHGGLHGGLMAVLIECGAAGIAVRAAGSQNIVAGDLHVRFLSPVRVGPARLVGRALRVSKRNVVVAVEVLDAGDDDRLAAAATLNYTRLDA